MKCYFKYQMCTKKLEMKTLESDSVSSIKFYLGFISTVMHWRRKWQPTPVFLPGESQGWGSLVG